MMPEVYSHRQEGERIFGRGRLAGGSTGSQTENGFAFAVAPFPFSKVGVRNGPDGPGRAGFARRSGPWTARTVLKDGDEGKGGCSGFVYR